MSPQENEQVTPATPYLPDLVNEEPQENPEVRQGETVSDESEAAVVKH